MAKRVTVQMVDDVDGSVYTDGGGESIEFAVDGVEYIIDLKAKNVTAFRASLNRFVEHATRVGGRMRPAPVIAAKPATVGAGKRDPEQLRAIRHWAREHGYQVSDRGRIPAAVEAAFAAGH